MEYYIKEIHLRSGKVIRVRKRKFTVWGDRYNSAKGQALIVFYYRKFIEHIPEGLTLSGISRACPSVSYDSFRSRLGDLTRWGFLSRRLSFNDYGPCYIYSISDKGREAVEQIPKPMFDKYLARIRAARREVHDDHVKQ